MQESVIFHENVGEFPLQLLADELDKYYIVAPHCSKVLCASDYGQPYCRVRRLTILFHKRLAVPSLDFTLDLLERSVQGFLMFVLLERSVQGF